MRIKLAIGIGLICLLGFAGGFSAVAMRRHTRAHVTPPPRSPVAAQSVLDPRFVYKVPIEGAPARGPDDALVTVVLFGDYGAEARALETALAARDDVRLVWRDLPGDGAPLAARAARAASAQGRFWELHDRLQAAAPAVDEALLLREAEQLGLDVPRFKVALGDESISRAITADMAIAQRFGLGAAPALFANGHYLPNPTLPRLRELLDEERGFAAELAASGTPRKGIYAALMRGALPNAGPISVENFE